MSASVVIGANFGDEGKGLMTDYLAYRDNTDGPATVVLFNGGSQRGHTVLTPDGTRHVFHHFGSGTLAGANTILSRHFISNPILFIREARELGEACPTRIFADGRSRVTTPYDMAINQIVEQSRGAERHGSCGMGINETMVRCVTPFRLSIIDLYDEHNLKVKLIRIKNEWVPARLKALGLGSISLKWQAVLESEKLIENFMKDCRIFKRSITCTDDVAQILHYRENIIFEAGQGLLLDAEHWYFPHVTNSRTGLANVVELALEAKLEDLDIYYMTRWYATRHGAGPFETEMSWPPTYKVEDQTNVPNDFQGTLRFGDLSVPLLQESISNDLLNAVGIRVNPALVITCLDQCDDGFDNATIENIASGVSIPLTHLSYGPTRQTMVSLADVVDFVE